jgi:hypothetical protein
VVSRLMIAVHTVLVRVQCDDDDDDDVCTAAASTLVVATPGSSYVHTLKHY